MTGAPASAVDDRVLLLPLTRRDADTTTLLLGNAGIAVEPCAAIEDAVTEMRRGAAALIVPEELIGPEQNAQLVTVLQDQPPWSDLPILVLTSQGADSVATREAVKTLGNVTLLERPLRVATLLSAVRTALRARERQYQIRGYLADRAQAEESLRRADQRKDEFLATLGHELRNPLAPLLSGLQFLRTSGVDDPRVIRITSVMDRQIMHLVRLVDDLLEVSRITRGLVHVRHDPVDVVSIVRDAVDSCRPVLEAAKHAVTVDLPPERVLVQGDAVRLTQVFANLLTNAAKYTNTGGRIHVAVSRDNQRAVVSVKDNGIGIPESHLASIFEMFTQVDRSNRRAQGGLGIGLTLVRSLVQLHGGRVEARSEGVGTGSEFVIELPLLTEALGYSPGSPQLRPFPNRRVLVVDDNRDAAETLGALLQALGAAVEIVYSGRAALDQVSRFRPDTILLDIGMPGMDGYEVARRLRAMPDQTETLLIALTGWGQEQDVDHSRAAGFDHHMVKPPDIDKLRDLLTKVGEQSG